MAEEKKEASLLCIHLCKVLNCIGAISYRAYYIQPNGESFKLEESTDMGTLARRIYEHSGTRLAEYRGSKGRLNARIFSSHPDSPSGKPFILFDNGLNPYYVEELSAGEMLMFWTLFRPLFDEENWPGRI